MVSVAQFQDSFVPNEAIVIEQHTIPIQNMFGIVHAMIEAVASQVI
jgi:hypothetical protein